MKSRPCPVFTPINSGTKTKSFKISLFLVAQLIYPHTNIIFVSSVSWGSRKTIQIHTTLPFTASHIGSKVRQQSTLVPTKCHTLSYGIPRRARDIRRKYFSFHSRRKGTLIATSQTQSCQICSRHTRKNNVSHPCSLLPRVHRVGCFAPPPSHRGALME